MTKAQINHTHPFFWTLERRLLRSFRRAGRHIPSSSLLASGNIHIIDVRSDPRAPQIHKTIPGTELLAKVGVALPHTTHCAPDEIIMSFMGSGTAKDGFEPSGAGFVSFDPKTFEIKQRWEAADTPATPQRFGYDFWYQPRHNVMISSEWGDPGCFTKGFDPTHVGEGRYGSKLYVWDWAKRTLKQELDVGVGALMCMVSIQCLVQCAFTPVHDRINMTSCKCTVGDLYKLLRFSSKNVLS